MRRRLEGQWLWVGLLLLAGGCTQALELNREYQLADGGGGSSSGTGGSGGSACLPIDDGNLCTNDICENGVAIHKPVAAGSACSVGGTRCDGEGTCVECLAAEHCAGKEDACQTRTCTLGKCGVDYAPEGTVLPMQTAGDCNKAVCNGKGGTKEEADAADLSDDKKSCTDDLCDAGKPMNPPKAAGTDCGVPGGTPLHCNATGTGIGCTVASECGAGDECTTYSCVGEECGVSFAGANTAVSAQTAGDCKTAVFDGSGHVIDIADDSDPPADDGNVCTNEVCSAGVPSHPQKMDGAGCSDGDACTQSDACMGGVCQGGNPVTCGALDQCHRAGTCDPATGACSAGPPKADGSACSEGNARTQTDTCQGGVCTGANPVVCPAPNPCHDPGSCVPATGVCTYPFKANGSGCDDGNACTQVDTCQNGVCTGASPVVCPAPDQCHDAGVCNAATGVCSNPAKANGSPCGGAATCVAGACAAPSCTGLASTCGPANNESCCASSVIPGGTYNRSNDVNYPATVADFRLDRFEITVGRFRKFVAGYPGNKPSVGAGMHPLIPGSGWDGAWNENLPVDQAALTAAVKCDVALQTWTDAAGANENLPMNCMGWYETFAFCAWDGGRLPTEAEWNYAAAGGANQRQYPWGNAAPDAAHAVYDCTGDGSAAGSCAFTDILKVGSKPPGDGKWGQADLAGSMWEWNLDWYATPYSNPCVNCANGINASDRVVRGGSSFTNASDLLSSLRDFRDPAVHEYGGIGAKCARTHECMA